MGTSSASGLRSMSMRALTYIPGRSSLPEFAISASAIIVFEASSSA